MQGSIGPSSAEGMEVREMETSQGKKKYLGVGLLLFLSILVLLVFSIRPSFGPELPTAPKKTEVFFKVKIINAQTLKEWLEKGRPFLLVNASWPQEYAQGHIPTAVSLHRLGLSNPGYPSSVANAKEGDRQIPVIFYCNGPAWSKADPCVRAIVRELQNGSKQVYWFKEGMRAWRALGYPMTSSSKKVF